MILLAELKDYHNIKQRCSSTRRVGITAKVNCSNKTEIFGILEYNGTRLYNLKEKDFYNNDKLIVPESIVEDDNDIFENDIKMFFLQLNDLGLHPSIEYHRSINCERTGYKRKAMIKFTFY